MKLHQVRLIIPTAPLSQAWLKITEGTLILNITLVRQKGAQGTGIACENQTWGLAGHMTSDGKCDIEWSVTLDAGGNAGG